eukprot:Skav219025  [mRNA]  locus=scaffold2142:585253:586332:+ [translate_table: standard]
MTSKHSKEEVHGYMLKCGISQVMVGMGMLVHVKEVDDHRFRAVDQDDVEFEFHVDIQAPNPRRLERWNRWKAQLQRCMQTSAMVRVMGFSSIAPRSLRLDENSELLSQAARLSEKQVRLFEMCAGGFGGWHRAASYLQNQGIDVFTKGAADLDAHMVTLWNQNARRLDNGLDEPPQCRQMDITCLHTWEHAVACGADTVTLSTPCKSFSLGGNQHGWETTDGMALAVALLMSKQYGFQTILVENVANLWLDGSFRSFLDAILRYVGLQLAFQRLVTLTNLHPAERSRLLLVLHPIEACETSGLPVLDFLYDLPLRNPMTLWSMDRWMEPPEELLIPLIIPAFLLISLSNIWTKSGCPVP